MAKKKGKKKGKGKKKWDRQAFVSCSPSYAFRKHAGMRWCLNRWLVTDAVLFFTRGKSWKLLTTSLRVMMANAQIAAKDCLKYRNTFKLSLLMKQTQNSFLNEKGSSKKLGLRQKKLKGKVHPLSWFGEKARDEKQKESSCTQESQEEIANGRVLQKENYIHRI